MKNRISILQGVTVCHYHTIPSELDLITLPPEREAVFNHLAQIHYSRFPEFIGDILKLVEKHTDVRVTDGPGDETQDIVSVAPTGERQLTQCKHTQDVKYHAPTEELDLLWVGCHRKRCDRGVLVTNSDVTVPAKRFVTDREFERLAVARGETPVEIDYWNGVRIWERIANSTAILDKWFSGMGQTHGLRKFWFDLVVHRLPAGQNQSIKSQAVLAGLISSAKLPEHESPVFKLNEEASFTIEDWFARDIDLGVNFTPRRTEHGLVNIPLSAIRIHVSVAESVGQFRPAKYRDAIVKLIGDRILSALPNGEWWHLIATTSKAFIFLQDVVEAKVISVSEAETYVRVADSPTSVEREWMFPRGDDYQRIEEAGDDDWHWKHIPSDTVVRLSVSQRVHPVAAYQQYVRQSRLVKQLVEYEFRAVESHSQEEFDRIRRIVAHPNWVIMSANDEHLFWAFPKGTEPDVIARVDATLQQEGINILSVTDEDRARIVSWIDIPPPHDEWLLNSSESDKSVPVSLDQRLFWLTREVPSASPRQPEVTRALVKFKTDYEAKNGYDFMQGRTSARISGAEIPRLLFDMMSLRGSRMLDIGFLNAKAHINLRVREQSLKPTHDLVPEYIAELDTVVASLIQIIGSESPVAVPEDSSEMSGNSSG